MTKSARSTVHPVWITANAEHLLCAIARDLIPGDEQGSDLLKVYLEEFPQMDHLVLLSACFSIPGFIPSETWNIQTAWAGAKHYCNASIKAWIEFTRAGLATPDERSFYITAYDINKALAFKMPLLWEALTRVSK